MLIKPKYLPTVVAHQEFDEFGDAVAFAPGKAYATQVVDRTLTPTFAEIVNVLIHPVSGTLTGTLDFYVYVDYGDNSASPPDADENKQNWVYNPFVDAGFAVPKWSVNLAWGKPLMKKQGSFDISAVGLNEPIFHTFNVATVLGGVVPPRFGILLANNTLANLVGQGTQGEKSWCQILGVQAESV